MIDGKSTSVDETASTGQLHERQDFSNVQGFQVAGFRNRTDDDTLQSDETWRDALRLELEARASRFHQAVDASIVLSNDGIVRWLGDPIGKLALGPDLLAPRAVILADDMLPQAAREIVAARLELWLAATTQRLLAPLFALQALHEESEPVRDLGAKIARSLGILDRDPVRIQVKALDQNARATLRKHGVRFGAYYIYVPAVLKPGARVLSLQLWGLQSPGVGADMLAQTLAPLASSGRTSLPYDHVISRESYRVAGFRPCGDRIVRVDIVERLADMIRAALLERSAKDESGQVVQGAPRGFVVNGQMTSLTGCSGEHFASILRSLGFECMEMKRSEFIGDTPAVEAQPTGVSPAPSEVSEHSSSPGEDTSPVVSEQAIDAPADSALEERKEDHVAGPGMETGSLEAHLDESRPNEPAVEPRVEMAFLPAATTPSESAPTSQKAASVADTIAVWRRAQKMRPHHRKGQHLRQTRNGSPGGEQSKAPPRDGRGDGGHSSYRERELVARRRAEQSASTGAAGAREGAADPSSTAGRPNNTHTSEKRRQVASNRDMPRDRPDSGLQQRATVDPNSPFAKLVELRSLLEAQSKKRP